MTRAARVAALAAALLASSFASGAGAHAGSTPATTAAPRDAIELVTQDPWTPLGGDLRLGVHITSRLAASPGARVRVVGFPAIGSRAEFDRAIVEGAAGNALDQVEIPVETLSADASGIRALVVGLESQSRDPDRLALRRPGVYPITVAIVTADPEAVPGASFTTFAVVTDVAADGQPRQLQRRLGVAWVLPLQEDPSMLPDGRHDPVVLRSFGVHGRLGRQAAALGRAGDVRLTLVPGPETLEAWVARGRADAAGAQGAAAVIDAAGRAEVVSTTYVPTDIGSLLRVGLDEVVALQLDHGREVLTDLLGAPPVTSTALVRPVSDSALARLRSSGVTHVVVDRSALVSDPADPTTLTQPFQLRPEGDAQDPLQAVASDSGLVSLLAGDASPALRAQRVLAGLSIVALEAPSATHAVVLASQHELSAPSALFDLVLAGLRGHPWLDSMTISDVFASVPPAGGRSPEVRAIAPMPVPSPPIAADPYRLTKVHVDAFAAVVGSDDPIVTEANRALLIVESSAFASAEGQARATATLDYANEQIDAFLAGIRVPNPGTITLTSRSGEIPLTFRNDTGRRIRITVTVEAPKLFFPEGSTYTIDLAPRSTTLPVSVEARTSGTFPLRLSVRTADGGLVIAETQLQVQSTVVSTVGLTLMIGAAVFLALWWGFHIRRNRRRRREDAT